MKARAKVHDDEIGGFFFFTFIEGVDTQERAHKYIKKQCAQVKRRPPHMRKESAQA